LHAFVFVKVMEQSAPGKTSWIN